MKYKILLVLFLVSIFLFSAQFDDEIKIEKFLSEQKEITYKKISNPKDKILKYELYIKQPLDWKKTKKGYFYQKVIYTHTGFDRPVLMQTQGYNIYDRKNELQLILNSNDLNIEHRYFGESIPNSSVFNWKYLNLYNAANDLHHINEIFRKLYKNKWISTGISKGGQTTIYYRYYFPDDVEVSIPYVAPINYTLEDPRIYSFLNNVGTEECRKKIENFQIYMLKNEEEALKIINTYSEARGLTYDYLGSINKAYEYCVLEYSFSFWQWGSSCNSIPDTTDIVQAVDYLLKSSNISFFSDQEIKELAPHYYQANTEMGYYGYNIASFKKYLKYFTENPSAIFSPKEIGKVKYSQELNKKLKKWLDTKANNIIYIYGETDTWSATKVNPSSQTNSVILELPGANHASARIINMSNLQKNELSEILYKWIGINPDYSLLK